MRSRAVSAAPGVASNSRHVAPARAKAMAQARPTRPVPTMATDMLKALLLQLRSDQTSPQTESAWPETLRPMGETRNSTMSAMSPAVTMRCSEVFSR